MSGSKPPTPTEVRELLRQLDATLDTLREWRDAGVLDATPVAAHVAAARVHVLDIERWVSGAETATLERATGPSVRGERGKRAAGVGTFEDDDEPLDPGTLAPFDCPSSWCGGHMVKRHRNSDGFPFYGCSNFPACRRVLQVEEVEQPAPPERDPLDDEDDDLPF